MSQDDDTTPRGMEIMSGEGGIYGLVVNGDTLCTSTCWHHMRKLAQQLDRVRALPRREAMHCLTEEIGFCDTAASRLFFLLHNEQIEHRSKH